MSALLYYLIIKPISFLPFWILYLLSDFFYLIIYKFFGYRTSVVTTNLTNSFPNKTPDEIREIQKLVMDRFRKMPESNLMQIYLDALASLKQKGVRISDRRKIKLLKVASAISVIYGEKEVSPDSLAEALKLVAIHEEEDVRKVDQVIFELGLSSYYKHIQKIQTVNSELQNAIKLSRSGGVDELKMLSTICNKASEMLEEMPQNPRLIPYIRQLKGSIFKARDILERKKAEIFG